MAIEGINGNVSNPVATTTTAITPPKPEGASAPDATKTTSIPPQHDTIELTGTALAKSLKLSGQSVAQIAQKMGLDAKTVNQFLGISTITATPTASPTANQAVTDSAATTQPYSPAEEVTESGSQKAAETVQGKK